MCGHTETWEFPERLEHSVGVQRQAGAREKRTRDLWAGLQWCLLVPLSI